jgi:signal transduction histidine kinase/ActR/RegA family two-component response regulator
MPESELALFLDQLPSGVVIVDERGRPVRMNQAARRYLGSAFERAQSLPQAAAAAGLRDAHTGRVVSPKWSPVARALQGEIVTEEDYLLPRGAETLELRVSAFPLREPSGAVTGAVSIFAHTEEHRTAENVGRLLEAERSARAETERALAALEQELAERIRAEDALHGSQQRLRLALEASRMGTWDYDVVNDHMEWSPEMAAVVNAPLDTDAPTLAAGFEYVHPDDRPMLERAFGEALEHGADFQVETRFVEQDGRVGWLLAKGRVFRDPEGKPLRMTGIAMDISERKEAEATRLTLSHSERLRALGQMASGIAHDLNQSLALISGYSDMARQELLLDLPDTSRVREMVEITSRAALEGGQRLKGLLSFVRTQELMAESEWVDLGELMRDVARLTEPRWRDATQAEGRPVNLEVTTDPGCTIHGSPGALREAFTNLIFNAVDALPHGGSIFLRAQRAAEDEAIVEVRDTGSGIPSELQSLIFDPFFTTKGERGTGLGLPQVLAIVERHSGRIELDSAPGRGTTFRMRFPIVVEPAAIVGDVTEKPTANGGHSIRILVVEDEQQLARMASLVLGQRGHHVVVASSGEEALERLHEGSFDLVISDLGLGAGKNGWDVAEVVRKDWPGTRFVLVTGWGAGIDPKEARKRGVDEVIAKPYRIADLRQIADSVAGTHDAMQ